MDPMMRIAVLLIATLLAAGPAFAQEPAKPPPTSPDGFVPVDAPLDPSDTIPAPLLVGTAYAVIWVVLFGYLWSIRSRLASVEREITAIDRRLASGRK
jgi:CcmD family protein